MALHGDIRINDRVIGQWQAVRQQHPPGEVNDYKVEVAYRDPFGVTHEAEGKIRHKFEDGAVVLSASVLTWAAGHLPPLKTTRGSTDG